MELKIQVPPTWPAGAKLVLVGEAPGKDEVEQKEGFVGAAGHALQKACGVAGLEWEQLARSNIAKRRPGRDHNDFHRGFYERQQEPIYTPTGKLSKRVKWVEKKSQELLEWEDLLESELRHANPNLIVACGNEALETITGLRGIGNYRGSVVESSWRRSDGTPFKVLATYHPSFIIRGGMVEFWVLAHDLKKAARNLDFPDIRREVWTQFIRPELVEILQCFQRARASGTLWTLDVETRAGTLACFAIAWQERGHLFSVCVPIATPSGAFWSPEDELRIWQGLKELADGNPYLANQNIEYDIYYLLRYGVEPSGVWMDTMLAHSILHPELPKGLDFLCSWYLDDVVYYKGEGRDWKAGDRDEQLWEYNVKDAVFTWRVAREIDRELKRRKMLGMYHGTVYNQMEGVYAK